MWLIHFKHDVKTIQWKKTKYLIVLEQLDFLLGKENET